MEKQSDVDISLSILHVNMVIGAPMFVIMKGIMLCQKVAIKGNLTRLIF